MQEEGQKERDVYAVIISCVVFKQRDPEHSTLMHFSSHTQPFSQFSLSLMHAACVDDPLLRSPFLSCAILISFSSHQNLNKMGVRRMFPHCTNSRKCEREREARGRKAGDWKGERRQRVLLMARAVHLKTHIISRMAMRRRETTGQRENKNSILENDLCFDLFPSSLRCFACFSL